MNASLTDPKGQRTTWTYDIAGRLARFAYTYDLAGRRTVKTITGLAAIARAEAYGYDAIAQVTAATYGAAGQEAFAYDPMGNRTATDRIAGGVSDRITYTSNVLNQYTSAGTGAPTYDANGNTLALGERSFAYDGNNRLISATAGAPLAGEHHAASFVYDGHNRQVSRTVDGQTTFFVWDGWSLLAEYQVQGGSPVLVTRYVHGPRQDEIILQQKTNQPTAAYLHEDALGSTYLLTDAAGAPVESYSYTAFGEVTAYNMTGSTVASPATRFLYTGREWIAELGINDHRNRFYLPSLGHWLSRDPIGERGGINLYAYCRNQPILLVDRDGRAWSWAAVAAGAAAGAAYNAAACTVSQAMSDNDIDWGTVGAEAAQGALAGAAAGAVVGAFTGDPSALAAGAAVLGGVIGGAIDGALDHSSLGYSQ